MNAFMCVIFTQSIRRRSLARLLISINLYQSGFRVMGPGGAVVSGCHLAKLAGKADQLGAVFGMFFLRALRA